jgi:hypothetical protein
MSYRKMVTPVLNRLDVTGCRSQEKRSRMVQAAANVIVSERHCSQPQNGVAANLPPFSVVCCKCRFRFRYGRNWCRVRRWIGLGRLRIRRGHGVGQNVWSGSGWYTFYWHESLLEGRVTPIFILRYRCGAVARPRPKLCASTMVTIKTFALMW